MANLRQSYAINLNVLKNFSHLNFKISYRLHLKFNYFQTLERTVMKPAIYKVYLSRDLVKDILRLRDIIILYILYVNNEGIIHAIHVYNIVQLQYARQGKILGLIIDKISKSQMADNP